MYPLICLSSIVKTSWSRWITTQVSEVVKKLNAYFARHGCPDYLVRDNGQPFASSNFHDFAKRYGFEQLTSSPNYAQSNGKVENALKKAKRLMKWAL